jgi:predicted ArsR family transcriptional regulator
MLNAVLREIRSAGGDDAVKLVFERIGRRSAERLDAAVHDKTDEDRIAALVSVLRASGVTADMQKTETGTIVLHEHACPYASVVAENPEACSAIHTILDVVVPGKAQQTESLATGGTECRFEISVDPKAQRETATAP